MAVLLFMSVYAQAYSGLGRITRQAFQSLNPASDMAVRFKIHIAFGCQHDIGIDRAIGNGRPVDCQPRLVCNQIRAASLACVQGLGVVRLMHYQVADELAEGRLVRVLREYEPKDLPIQLVYPHSLQLSPRVRTFVDWACPQLERLTPDLAHAEVH